MDFMTFQPIYQERVWGGRKLESKLGRQLPASARIGESWEVVDRPEAQSLVTGGEWAGRTLRAALESASRELMGPEYSAECPFPVLVKWLDCQERLSLQVHPPREVASQLGGEPKTELWYVTDTSEEAAVMIGFRRRVSREQIEQSLQDNTLERLLHRCEVRPGDSMFVPAGRIHAIDAGCLILEIQQNSDTTYRVYDWNRVGLNGKARPLHFEEAMSSIDFDDVAPTPKKDLGRVTELANCSEFRVTRYFLKTGETSLEFGAWEQPRLVHVVSGDLHDMVTGVNLRMGDCALLPFCGKYAFRASQDSTVLITDNFA